MAKVYISSTILDLKQERQAVDGSTRSTGRCAGDRLYPMTLRGRGQTRRAHLGRLTSARAAPALARPVPADRVLANTDSVAAQLMAA
jgi:hypothetical protein